MGVAAEASRPSGAGAVPTGAAFGPPNARKSRGLGRPAERGKTRPPPRDLHGAARGVRVKLEFSAKYWSLDQAKAWALTRHPELVSWAAKPANFKGAPVALAARIKLSTWSEQEDRAKTSTPNSGAQAAGRLQLNRLRRGTSRKAAANMDLVGLKAGAAGRQ